MYNIFFDRVLLTSVKVFLDREANLRINSLPFTPIVASKQSAWLTVRPDAWSATGERPPSIRAGKR